MGTMTPAQRRALYESARFARETTYNGPLGPEYTPAGTRLRLWLRKTFSPFPASAPCF